MSDNNSNNKWPASAKALEGKHKELLLELKKNPPADFQEQLIAAHNQAFERIDCLSCANCCKTSPPIIIPADAKRITQHLGMPPKQFLRQYTIEDINGDMVFKTVPCVFLKEDNYCKIYDVRPEACRRYPHTDEKEYLKRTNLNLANAKICPAAFDVLERLGET